MRVGILGSGLMGGKLGTLFARAGHEVVFSYARSQQKLKRLARDAKGKAPPGTPREAAQETDALLLAAHWSRMDDVLSQTPVTVAYHSSHDSFVTCPCVRSEEISTRLERFSRPTQRDTARSCVCG